MTPDESSLEFVDPGPTLGEMVRFMRLNWRRVSLRSLARETRISAGQLSRIESGETERPEIRTLQALSPALDLNLSLLLALAGHLDPDRARRQLSVIVSESRDELAEEYEDDGAYADELLAKVEALEDDEGVRDLAMELATLATRPVGAPAELAEQAPVGATDRGLLTDVIRCWEEMTADRRWRLLEIARDFSTASAEASK
jgi:transcriptional regulator with XRE-family HTH domain